MNSKNRMMKKFISTMMAVLMFVAVFATASMVSEAKAGHVYTASTEDILDELNDIREDYGCRELTMSQPLSDCAAVRSVEISTFFSHTRPGGGAWYTVNESIMYGENLLKTQINHEADDIVQMWMDSPAHKDLILDGNYRTVGIATCHVGDTDYWVLEFGYR